MRSPHSRSRLGRLRQSSGPLVRYSFRIPSGLPPQPPSVIFFRWGEHHFNRPARRPAGRPAPCLFYSASHVTCSLVTSHVALSPALSAIATRRLSAMALGNVPRHRCHSKVRDATVGRPRARLHASAGPAAQRRTALLSGHATAPAIGQYGGRTLPSASLMVAGHQ